jgi:hypothetical protein
MLVISKDDTETIERLRAAEAEAEAFGIKNKWGGKKPTRGYSPSVIKDADEDGTADEYPDRKNTYYMTVSANSRFAPGIVDRDRVEILDESQVYSGAFARVSVTAFAYDQQGNKGVSFGLNNVQMLGGGERLLGGPRAQDEFADDLPDEDTDSGSDLL